MTSNTDSAGDDANSAPMDAEDYPETAAGTSHGAGDAETELVPPATVVDPAHAWSKRSPSLRRCRGHGAQCGRSRALACCVRLSSLSASLVLSPW